jgi:hypothetical protein
MSDRHVADELTAYLHNELSEGDRARVTEHLARCAECRDAYSETRTGSELAMRLPQVAAPEDLWEGIERRLDRERADGDRLRPVPLQRPVPARWPLAAAAALLLLAGAWFGTRGRLDLRAPEGGPATDGWHVRRVAGAPVVGGAPLAGAHGEEAELRIGGELVTDAASRAALTVADIGHLTVEPGTRLRLVASGRNEHRVALDRGTIAAVVIAPPRLFLVETPSALAVDLGCAYTLTVDDDGAARLSVTAGWVALENGVHDALVPAGAECTTRPGAGPGLPVWRSAAPGFRAAAARLETAEDAAALDTLLAAARPIDSLTLWHLLPRLEPEPRARLYDTLIAFRPLPEGVTRDGVLNLDDTMLESWKETLRHDW